MFVLIGIVAYGKSTLKLLLCPNSTSFEINSVVLTDSSQVLISILAYDRYFLNGNLERLDYIDI